MNSIFYSCTHYIKKSDWKRFEPKEIYILIPAINSAPFLFSYILSSRPLWSSYSSIDLNSYSSNCFFIAVGTLRRLAIFVLFFFTDEISVSTCLQTLIFSFVFFFFLGEKKNYHPSDKTRSFESVSSFMLASCYYVLKGPSILSWVFVFIFFFIMRIMVHWNGCPLSFRGI